MRRLHWTIFTFLTLLGITALIEYWMGRLPLGPDGRFGLWAGNIWSSEQSQRFADPYSFTHLLHGFLFYLFLWFVARRLPLRYRFLLAVVLECGWEILENSSFIINRYREATISLGYVGDSILNSMSDVLMMALGFWVAAKGRVWVSVAVVLLIELLLAWWLRDNLTLNIIMLIHPFETIKTWQSVGH